MDAREVVEALLEAQRFIACWDGDGDVEHSEQMKVAVARRTAIRAKLEAWITANRQTFPCDGECEDCKLWREVEEACGG